MPFNRLVQSTPKAKAHLLADDSCAHNHLSLQQSLLHAMIFGQLHVKGSTVVKADRLESEIHACGAPD